MGVNAGWRGGCNIKAEGRQVQARDCRGGSDSGPRVLQWAPCTWGAQISRFGGGSCTQLLLSLPGPPHCLLLGPSLTAPRPSRLPPSFSVPPCSSLSPFPDCQLLPSPFYICLPTCPAPGAVAKPQAGSTPSRDSRVNHRTLPTPSSWPALGSAEAAGRACAAASAPARCAGGTSDQPRASRVRSLAAPSDWPGARGSGPAWVQISKRLRSRHPNLS